MTDAIELLRRVSQKLKLKRVLDLLDEHDPEAPQLEQGRRLAPTRPHPNLSPDPEVLRLAGRMAGATDRIRDALAGRAGPGAERGPLGKTADPEARHPSPLSPLPSPRAPDPRSISFRPGICFPAWPGSAERV
jgi:hypothetical protein